MMNLINRIIFCCKYLDRDFMQIVTHLFYTISSRLHFSEKYFLRLWRNAVVSYYKKKLVTKNGDTYFDFNGSKIVDVSDDRELTHLLNMVFADIFYIPCFCNDNHDASVVLKHDKYLLEGPYCYKDDCGVDVTVKNGDVVIDAGAWIGDFSAYAASNGAISYAFEPVSRMYEYLCKTAVLNDNKIVPIKMALGDKIDVLEISINLDNPAGNSLVEDFAQMSETVHMTTIDDFVIEYNLTHVDFIKSDIEGFERNLLLGAKNTLKKFAPKLSICTYHLPDDPQVLSKIILEANPLYKIVYLKHKLVACVP